jgi:hypothetical protein
MKYASSEFMLIARDSQMINIFVWLSVYLLKLDESFITALTLENIFC